MIKEYNTGIEKYMFDEKSDYYIFSTKRSGHHAIINWLCLQINDIVWYDNLTVGDFGIVGSRKCIHSYGGDSKTIYAFESVNISDFVKRFGRVKPVIILRDLYNTYASLVKWFNYSPELLDNQLKLWKELACRALSGDYFISFNEWFSNREYRKRIAKDFFVKNTDLGVGQVMKPGGGSSFDKRKYKRTAGKMDVLNRHKEVEVKVSKELKRINNQIF